MCLEYFNITLEQYKVLHPYEHPICKWIFKRYINHLYYYFFLISQSQNVLILFLFFVQFQSRCSYIKFVLTKKECISSTLFPIIALFFLFLLPSNTLNTLNYNTLKHIAKFAEKCLAWTMIFQHICWQHGVVQKIDWK